MIKLYPSWFVFFAMVLLGVSFVLSGDSWFSVWIGFELSLLGFLPMFSSTFVVVEGMIKYFLIQAGGSALFLFSFLMSSLTVSGFLTMVGMFLKLGVFPFYQWVPMVMSCFSWVGCLLLSTIQKIGPLFVLLSHRLDLRSSVMVSGVLSVLAAGLLGFNQSHLRALMGYSSVSHTGWMLCGGCASLGVFSFYFLFYALLLFFLFISFDRFNSHLVVDNLLGSGSSLLLVFLMVTLSGMPPFLIFFFKVSIIYFLSSVPLFIGGLLLGSALSIYYYFTFIIPSLSSFGSFLFSPSFFCSFSFMGFGLILFLSFL